MIALLQRVTGAQVSIGGEVRAIIGPGLAVFIGVRPTDTPKDAMRLLERVLGYRVFADQDDRMNLSLRDVRGGLLLVPQFTLAADSRKGSRPGFSTAARPEQAGPLYEALVAAARTLHSPVESGVFSAAMQVSLTNDGPVTIWLES
jgi:D-tyrosyl-tRNA(Tyr) deacylase